MLRVEIDDSKNVRTVKVLGRCSGEYADYARTLVTRCTDDVPLVVDLNEVTFLDSAGEQVLLTLGRLGAVFIADNVYVRYFCERLQLPLVRAEQSSRSHSELECPLRPE